MRRGRDPLGDPALSDPVGGASSDGEVSVSGTPKCGTNIFPVKHFLTITPGQDRV